LEHVSVAAATGIAYTDMAHQPGSDMQDLPARVRARQQQPKDGKRTQRREADRARHGALGRKARSPAETAKPKDNGELDQYHTRKVVMIRT
jgi:hypothetical protein